MNTVNASSGYSPFQLHLGRVPRMLPPLIDCSPTKEEPEDVHALSLLKRLEMDVMNAQDNLLAAKAAQATSVNKSHSPELSLKISDKVLLATKHRRREYIQKNDKHITK
ncbi:uncharacterized protein HD556DRAFT_1215873, partial [Suillus plorans]